MFGIRNMHERPFTSIVEIRKRNTKEESFTPSRLAIRPLLSEIAGGFMDHMDQQPASH